MKWPYYPTDILALCETKLDDSIDSGNFFERGYIDLIQKDSVTHINGLALYLKKDIRLQRTYLKKTLQILIYDCLYLFSVLLLFLLSITFFVFIHNF